LPDPTITTFISGIFGRMKLKQKLAINYIRAKFKVLSGLSPKYAAKQAFKLFCTPLHRSLAKEPFKNAEPLQMTINGLKVNGNRWNHPQAKKILIVHGFSSASYKFERYISPLIKKGYEVLAFDAPAHGTSEGKQINAKVYSELIIKINKEFGPMDAYLCHSFGGIAVCLALEQMPHAEQTKVVLIAPATETSSAVDGAFALLKLKNAAVRKEFDDIIFRIDNKLTSWYSIRRAMQNIHAKVLWLHDKEDDITPYSDAEKVKNDNHPNITFVTTKGLGHSRIYNDIAVKKQVIDFLGDE